MAPEEKGPFFSVTQGYFLLSGIEAEARRIWAWDFFSVFLSPVSQPWSLLAGSQVLRGNTHLQWGVKRMHSVTKE